MRPLFLTVKEIRDALRPLFFNLFLLLDLAK